ncbi:hypothetical protein WJX72_000359 [[Myrmecia] bisecta]|uniref:Uncharacterized protein n=1 Tax=[Myrmecia] bisecta TaxID=41462 RepID=A0AAW1QDY1_9CHLO
MGRGKAQKRRAKNVLKAKQKGDSIGPLPPPPVISKKKSGEYVPRSFQRMMSLKAALERKDAASHKRPPIVNPTSQRSTAQRSAAAGSVPGKRTPTAELDPPRFLDEDPAQQDELALLHNPHTAQPQSVPGMEKADGQTGQAQLDRQDWMQPGSSHVRKADQAAKSAEEPFSRKAVRPSRKEYLKARKARRKKKGGRAADGDEDEREAQLLQDRTKPAFGEQALAPIKVNLKRRHWDPNDGERRANERCKQIFLKQMSAAERQNTLAANTRANAAPSSGGRKRAKRRCT